MGTAYFKQSLSSTSTEPEILEERKGVSCVASTTEAALSEDCCTKPVLNIAGRQQRTSVQSVTRVLTTNTARGESLSSDQKSSASCTSFRSYPVKRIVIVGTRRCGSADMESGCDLDAMPPSVLHLTQQRRSTAHVITATAIAPKPQELKPSSLHYANFDPKRHQQHSASRRLSSSYVYATRDTAQLRGRRADAVAMQKQAQQRYPKREINFLTHSQPCGTTVAGFAAFLMTILPPPDVSVTPCHRKETPVVSDERITSRDTPSTTKATHESACSTSASQSAKGRQVSLYDYLMLLRHRLMCCNSCFIIGGIYVNRFLRRHPELQIAPHELQYLSLISVVTAAKYIDDVFQTNSDYARVGGLPLNRFNTLEHYFLAGLGYSLHVTEEQFFAQLAVQESALAAGFVEAARSALLLCRFTVPTPSVLPDAKYPHQHQQYPNQHQENGAPTVHLQHASTMEPAARQPQITTEAHSVSARQQQVSYSQEAKVMGGCGNGACHVASCKASVGCALPKPSSGARRVSQHTMRVRLETPMLSDEVSQFSKVKVGGELVTPVPRLSTVSTRAPSSVRASSMSYEKEPFLNSSASSLSHSDTSSSSVAVPVPKTPTTDDEMELVKHPYAADFSFSRVDGTGGPIEGNADAKHQQFTSHPSGFETDDAKQESDESQAANDTDDGVSTVYCSLNPTVAKENTSNCASCAWSEPHEMRLPRTRMVQHSSEGGATQPLVPASYSIQTKRRTYAAHQGVSSRGLHTAPDDMHCLSTQARPQAHMRKELKDKKDQPPGHETTQQQNVTHQNGCFAGVPVHTSALGAGSFQTSSIQHSSPFRKKGNEGAYPFLSSTGQSCSTVSLHAHTLDWNSTTKQTTRRLSDWVPVTNVPGSDAGKSTGVGNGDRGDAYISRLHQSHSGTWASYAPNAATVCTRSQDVGAISVSASPSLAVAASELADQFQEGASCVHSHLPSRGKYLETSSSATARCSAKFGNAQGVGDQTDGLEFRKQQPSYCAALRTASGFCAAAVAPPPPPSSAQSECHLELHAPTQFQTSSQSGLIKTGSPRYPVFAISSGGAHCNVHSEATVVGYYSTS